MVGKVMQFTVNFFKFVEDMKLAVSLFSSRILLFSAAFSSANAAFFLSQFERIASSVSAV